jgi:hypothetical protein
MLLPWGPAGLQQRQPAPCYGISTPEAVAAHSLLARCTWLIPMLTSQAVRSPSYLQAQLPLPLPFALCPCQNLQLYAAESSTSRMPRCPHAPKPQSPSWEAAGPPTCHAAVDGQVRVQQATAADLLELEADACAAEQPVGGSNQVLACPGGIPVGRLLPPGVIQVVQACDA